MSRNAWMCVAIAAITLTITGCEVGTEPTSDPPSPSGEPTANQAPAGAPNALFPSTAGRPANSLAHGNLAFVNGFQAGYAQALSTGKPMLVFFSAQWCKYCHQMADDAFTNPQIMELSNHFVCILVDADSEPEVCRKFRVQGYPTVQFLSPRGAPLNRLVGKKATEQVMLAMQAALQNIARKNDAADTKSR